MLRRNTNDDSERFEQWLSSLDQRWQQPIRSAITSRDQFLQVVASTAAGPTRDRLEANLDTVNAAVARVTDAAWRAANASYMAAGLDVSKATGELKEARRRLDMTRTNGGDTTAAQAQVEALSERHRAIHDALNFADDAATGLHEANVRLETIVARAATVSMRTGSDQSLDSLEAELGEVVQGLSALDESLAEFG